MHQHHHGRGTARRGGGPRQGSRRVPPRPHASLRSNPSSIDDYHPSRSEVKLITNAYNLITANQEFIVHEYELLIRPSPTCRDLPPRVLTRAYVARSIRQLIMLELMPNLTEIHPSHGGVIIGPLLDIIYSIQPLFNQKSEQARLARASLDGDELRFSDVEVVTDLISRLKVDIVIKFNRICKVEPCNYTGTLHHSIMQHQLMMHMSKYESVYFPANDNIQQSGSRLDLISSHLMGICISGVRRSMENNLLVVVNCSHSYLTLPYSLMDLLASFLAEKPEEKAQSMSPARRAHLLTSVKGDEHWFVTFCSILNGFKCRATNPDGSSSNLRFELTRESAGQLSINDTVTLVDFYRELGMEIDYPNLPCLKSRSVDHPFYPMEACSLLPGQKVPIFRLSALARNHLAALHKPQPNATCSMSSRARDEVVAINKTQFKAFGVQLSKKPVETSGRMLGKPSLQYKNQMIDPTRDFWESGIFYQSIDLMNNWCVVDTVGLHSADVLMPFMKQLSEYSSRVGIRMGPPYRFSKPKQDILSEPNSIERLIEFCLRSSRCDLRFFLFVIDSTSTQLNRMIHLAFDDHPKVTATCVRSESILNQKQRKSIYRTLVHKLNARLGGTNHIYNHETLEQLSIDPSDLMVVGLDVTHPDNELNGVSIVGCAYTFCRDLFRHKSLVWPQRARKEIITRMDALVNRLLVEYAEENANRFPKQIIVYRDGVSHEEFDRVRLHEITKAQQVIEAACESRKQKPNLSYIIAQKRHTMRFFQRSANGGVQNPPGGTLIDQGVVTQDDREFYLYSNTSPQATARPLHYHVLLNGLGLENLQKLTYYLCFNFGKCSSSLSMPSSLRYAHNAAYDARNRVIASKEFSENQFYTTKFFC